MMLLWLLHGTDFAQMSFGIVSLLFIGHAESSGAVHIAAASLGNMFANVTGFSVGIGLCTAMDTLCSQAYGAGKPRVLGLVLQRAIVILAIISLPIAVLWYFTDTLLLALGQDPEVRKHHMGVLPTRTPDKPPRRPSRSLSLFQVSRLAGQFVFTLTAGLYPSLLFEAQKKYLQAQGITRPPMYVVLICMVLFPGIAYLYVFTFNLGFLVCASACVMYFVAVQHFYAVCNPRFSRVHQWH